MRPAVYFAGSIRGGRDDAALYRALINHMSETVDVLTEHVGEAALQDTGESELSDRDIQDRDLAWLRSADMIVAEVSVPSLGVGYEIAHAVTWGKPVLVVHRSDIRVSAMVAGSPSVETFAYQSPDDLFAKVGDWITTKAASATA